MKALNLVFLLDLPNFDFGKRFILYLLQARIVLKILNILDIYGETSVLSWPINPKSNGRGPFVVILAEML